MRTLKAGVERGPPLSTITWASVIVLATGVWLAAAMAHAASFELVIGDDYPPFLDKELPN
ncbi:MAG: hypothetical protein ACRBM6_10450 [Geminicoccales bacterium]